MLTYQQVVHLICPPLVDNSRCVRCHPLYLQGCESAATLRDRLTLSNQHAASSKQRAGLTCTLLGMSDSTPSISSCLYSSAAFALATHSGSSGNITFTRNLHASTQCSISTAIIHRSARLIRVRNEPFVSSSWAPTNAVKAAFTAIQTQSSTV